MITDFNGAGAANADGYSLSGSTLTLTDVDAAKNLQTGQAVLYTVAAGYKPINGLNSGQVYFIKVGESGGKPTLKFYLDPKEIDKFLGKTISLKVPEGPSNVCFGGKDKKTLFVTARTGLYAIRCTVAGVGSQ